LQPKVVSMQIQTEPCIRSITHAQNFYRLVIFTCSNIFPAIGLEFINIKINTTDIKQKETIAPNRVILGL
jgi:hypothetical protein